MAGGMGPAWEPGWSAPTDGDDDTGSDASFLTAAYGPFPAGPIGHIWTDGAPSSANGFDAFVLLFTGSEPATPVGDPRDRLRSTASEDLGSLLDAVEAIPVDLGFDVALTNAVSLEPAVRTRYRELTRATDSETVDLMVYPRPRQNSVMEEQFDGVTVLSRLSTWYPPRFYGTVTELGIANTDGTSTAQQVLEGLLAYWTTLQPWLTYKPVPDLRMPTGGEYSDPGEGVAVTDTMTIKQDPEERSTWMSALDILHDLLSPFPGTVVRQDSEGDLTIVPVYGPDADAIPAVVLRDFDLYSVSTGKPDPFTTINRATFVSTGSLTRQEWVPVMQPAWFQIGSGIQFGRDTWFPPPGDRVNLQPPPSDAVDTLQEGLSAGAPFTRQLPQLWPLAVDAIPAGDGISLHDDHNDPLVTCAWRRYNGDNLEASGTETVTLGGNVIPFSGQWVTAFSVTAGATSGETMRVTMRARWNGAARGIEWQLGTPMYLESSCILGCRGWVFEFTLNDASVAYSEAGQTSVTFGIVESGDSLPTEDGGNAIQDSQDAFGVRERTITVRGYALSLESLSAAARGYVLHNITPRVTREIELSLGAQGVVFDTIGRLVELPSGETGILNGLTYSDEFTSGSWSKTARIQLRDMTGPGAVPPNPWASALTDTTGNVFTDTTGAPITLAGEET